MGGGRVGLNERGWIKQELNAIARGKRDTIRSPIAVHSKGMIKSREHADRGLDLQFGRNDDISNIVSTPARVNTSVG
jgi:hypothetical protein